MWDNVPWMVGGGVSHSVEVCRLLAYVATGGREGIVGSKDLEVTAQSSPAASVKVWPGACAIIDREQSTQYGLYTAQKLAAETVPIAPTGAAARSDMVMALIRNPYRSGSTWPDPGSDPAARQAYEYVKTWVESGVTGSPKTVKALGKGYSAIALARIDLPANASTVQQSYIKDLRGLIAGNAETLTFVTRPGANQTLTSGSFVNWPSVANQALDVPEWATHVNLRALIGGVKYGPGNVYGNVRLSLNDTLTTPSTAYDESVASGTDKATLIAAGDDLKIPASWRGTSKTVKIEGMKGGGTASLIAGTSTTIEVAVTWRTKPETNL